MSKLIISEIPPAIRPLMLRLLKKCHSEAIAEESPFSNYNKMRFFTPLRSVQNDKRGFSTIS